MEVAIAIRSCDMILLKIRHGEDSEWDKATRRQGRERGVMKNGRAKIGKSQKGGAEDYMYEN